MPGNGLAEAGMTQITQGMHASRIHHASSTSGSKANADKGLPTTKLFKVEKLKGAKSPPKTPEQTSRSRVGPSSDAIPAIRKRPVQDRMMS
jgi:hypothetical protein